MQDKVKNDSAQKSLLTFDELYHTVADLLTEITELKEILRHDQKNHTKKESDPEYIRRKEARELLGGISNPTIIAYEKRGLLNPLRIGGTILYNKGEILKVKK